MTELLSASSHRTVLILVVMEEGQRPSVESSNAAQAVLILVVMEEGQRPSAWYGHYDASTVLILVVMEEGQRPRDQWFTSVDGITRLNPCCNGRGSKTPAHIEQSHPRLCCLNPCCNGRGSKTL